MAELFTNSLEGYGARGTLASDPGTGATLTLTTGHGARFPAVVSPNVLRLQCEDELMICTAHTAASDVFTVTREAEGSANVAHAALAPVNAVLTADALGDIPLGVYHPSHHALLGTSWSPDFTSVSVVLGGGYAYLVKVYLPKPVTLGFWETKISAAGVTLTADQNFAGVYSSSGTLLGKTADQSTTWTSTGAKRHALTAEAGQSLTLGGPGVWVHLAMLANGTTKPGVAGVNNAGFPTPNLNLTVPSVRTGYTGGGTATVLPATLGTVVANTQMFLMAVSA